MKIVDLHSDLFTDVAWRVSQGETNVFDTVHYPQLLAGGIDTVICVFWVEDAHLDRASHRFSALEQRVLADLATSRHARIVTDFSTIAPSASATRDDRINIVLGIEGMNFLEERVDLTDEEAVERELQRLHELGIRHSMLVWNDNNALASGTGARRVSATPGLSDAGRRVVRSTARRGWIIDVSHLDVPSFWNTLESTDGTVMASHSNAFAVCGHERNLRDDQLLAIAERGGLIGLNSYHEFVHDDHATVDTFIDHAVHIANRIGTQHLAFGFDFLDYLPEEFGSAFMRNVTEGLVNARDIPALLQRMSERGFSDSDIENIAFLNATRWLHQLQATEQ